MANLASSAFLALASQCATLIALDALAAVTKTGSNFNEIAIHLKALSTCWTEVAMAHDESGVLVVTPWRRRW